jgi:hypothetical protein
MSATAQTTSNSTPKDVGSVQGEAAAVSRETQQLLLELRIQRLIGEVKAGRALIAKQKEELAAADAQLTSEKDNSASLERSNAFATVEAGHLHMSIAYQKDALDTKAEIITVLKERNEDLKKQASKNRKRAFWATAAAAVLGGVLIMK